MQPDLNHASSSPSDRCVIALYSTSDTASAVNKIIGALRVARLQVSGRVRFIVRRKSIVFAADSIVCACIIQAFDQVGAAIVLQNQAPLRIEIRRHSFHILDVIFVHLVAIQHSCTRPKIMEASAT